MARELMMRVRILTLAAGVLMLFGANLASASLIGAVTLETDVTSGTISITPTPGPFPAIVGDPGPEYTVCVYSITACIPDGLLINIDINASGIDFTMSGTTGDAGIFDLTFTFLTSDMITSVTPSAYQLDFGQFILTAFDSDSIQFTGDDLGDNQIGTVVTRTLHFDVTTESSVPEPGALALMALGLAGIGFARRRVTRLTA